jgi:hypothetical protein
MTSQQQQQRQQRQLSNPKEIAMKFATVSSLLSMFVASSALAQTADQPAPATPVAATPAQEEPQTVTSGLRGGPAQISGWFVAPTFTTSSFDGSLAYSPGIRTGIFLNRRVAVGLAGHAVGNGDSYYYGTPVRNVGTYGGLLLQYVVESNRLVHATFESTLGGGRWCVEISEERDGCMGRNFLAFEPMANVELNVAKHVRVAAGVGYRFAVAGSGPGPDSDRLSSLAARTSIIFGSF